MSTKFNGSAIKTMSIDYVKRMYDASQKSVNGVDLNKEFMVLKFSKADLEYLLKPTGCTGVLCLFGIDGGKQSVILVPHDSSNKALPIDSSGVIKGIEEWDIDPPKVHDIVFPSDPNNDEISAGVSDVLTNLGIL